MAKEVKLTDEELWMMLGSIHSSEATPMGKRVLRDVREKVKKVLTPSME